MPDGVLQRVYDLQTQSETDAYYTEWATPEYWTSVAVPGQLSGGDGLGPSRSVPLDALEAGGHLVFSYNDHALADPVFVAALDEALSRAGVFSEHGPHIEALGTTSTVFVLQRR